MSTQWTKQAATILGGLLLTGTMAPRAVATAMGTVAGLSKVTRIGETAPGGVIVGGGQVGSDPSAPSHAFFSVNGVVTDLGTLGGSTSSAAAVNASGQVVGQSALPGDSSTHAFLYSGGSLHDLGTLGGGFSTATGINTSGQVVGQSVNASGATRAFLDSGGTMTDLGTLGGPSSSAAGINASGQIVGQAGFAGGGTHAFLLSGGTMNDLGTLGGSSSFGYGINGAGTVVGQSYTTGDAAAHAFLDSHGVMTDLGTLPGFASSVARSINDAGQVVGNSYGKVDPKTGAFLQHAFLFDHGTLNDLNASLPAGSGWVLTEATSISNAGSVAGFGLLNGQRQAFQLKLDGTANIPEPTTLALLGLILTGAGVRAIARMRRARAVLTLRATITRQDV